jgi:hypothetical protein
VDFLYFQVGGKYFMESLHKVLVEELSCNIMDA